MDDEDGGEIDVTSTDCDGWKLDFFFKALKRKVPNWYKEEITFLIFIDGDMVFLDGDFSQGQTGWARRGDKFSQLDVDLM
jgi:hypothetical protein